MTRYLCVCWLLSASPAQAEHAYDDAVDRAAADADRQTKDHQNKLMAELTDGGVQLQEPELEVFHLKVGIINLPEGGTAEIADACAITGKDCITKAREKARCCAERDRYKAGVSTKSLVAVGSIALILGGAIGFGAGVLYMERKRQ